MIAQLYNNLILPNEGDLKLHSVSPASLNQFNQGHHLPCLTYFLDRVTGVALDLIAGHVLESLIVQKSQQHNDCVIAPKTLKVLPFYNIWPSFGRNSTDIFT